jgi:hypothetical protein
MIEITYNSKAIYTPVFVESDVSTDGEIEISIYNSGGSIKKDVGLYLESAKNFGELNKLPDKGPYIDYDDVIRWGNAAQNNSSYGGLVLVNGSTETRFTRLNGSKRKNKIIVQDLNPGDSFTVKLKLEVPPALSSRRLFVSVRAE